MKISRVTEKDIEEIIILEEKLLTSSLGSSFLVSNLNNEYFMYYKISEEVLVGYLGFIIHDDNAEMLNFIIREEFQNKGYGTKLLDYCLNELKKNKVNFVSLEVRESNKKAINFYEKNGFKMILKKDKYYFTEDGFLYGKKINEE